MRPSPEYVKAIEYRHKRHAAIIDLVATFEPPGTGGRTIAEVCSILSSRYTPEEIRFSILAMIAQGEVYSTNPDEPLEMQRWRILQ